MVSGLGMEVIVGVLLMQLRTGSFIVRFDGQYKRMMLKIKMEMRYWTLDVG